MKLSRLLAFALLMPLANCVSNEPMPLIFAQSHIVGISIQSGTSAQTGDFTLGYKSFDLAVVPVSKRAPDPDGKGGTSSQIKASMNNKSQDSLSVLGQFQVNTNTSSGGQVALGEFFATGVAAQALAVGFGTQLCNSSSNGSSGGSSGSSSSSSGGSGHGAQDCGPVFSNLTSAIGADASSSSGSSSSSSSSSGGK